MKPDMSTAPSLNENEALRVACGWKADGRGSRDGLMDEGLMLFQAARVLTKHVSRVLRSGAPELELRACEDLEIISV